jgi:hypothetical protein
MTIGGKGSGDSNRNYQPANQEVPPPDRTDAPKRHLSPFGIMAAFFMAPVDLKKINL